MRDLIYYLLSPADPDSVVGVLMGIVLVWTFFIVVFGSRAILTVGLEWLWN